MKMTKFRRIVSYILCFVLIAVTALFTTGCNDTEKPQDESPSASQEQTSEASSSLPGSTDSNEVTVVGTGETAFFFNVTDVQGNVASYKVQTDKKTVGEALVENGLIAGEEGPYGLYVKTVDGTTLDYDSDGKYWAFYVNGEYGSAGVDQTDIVPSQTYEFRAE